MKVRSLFFETNLEDLSFQKTDTQQKKGHRIGFLGALSFPEQKVGGSNYE